MVGVVAGAVVLGEHVTWNQPIGALITITGIAISQDRLRALITLARKLAKQSNTDTTTNHRSATDTCAI